MDTSEISNLNRYNRRIELLAPAGNRGALHAAVENGADAVYLGGRSFNARENADNFDADTLREELLYAHARGVNIYLTLNTLISDDEMKQALEFAAEARYAGIDGIIVQDLGLAAALRKVMPDVPLHGSTQMTVYDLEGVRVLEAMGFRRVVLARELPLEEISYIARNTKLEIEAFVHGALCVCYSGQCLMSSMIGGRSGNRGKCAQPCRLPWQLVDMREGKPVNQTRYLRATAPSAKENASGSGSGYLMSPKDMSMLDYMGDIANSGITSLKIEGRMKSPEYVATVVRLYRKYLDMAVADDISEGVRQPGVEAADRHDLLQIYNRGGFSSGYMKGKSGADMMSYEKPNNSGIYLGKVQAYDSRSRTITVRLEWDLSIGDGVEIWTGDSDSPGGTVTSLNTGRQNVRIAKKGELASVGEFRGRITPGSGVYKTLDITLNKTARETFSGKIIKRAALKGKAFLEVGQPLTLNVGDTEGHIVTARGTLLPEEAINKPLSDERLKEQLSRTGSTPFYFSELEIDIASGLTIPISEINEVRRQALDELYKIRADRYPDRRNRDGAGRQALEGMDRRDGDGTVGRIDKVVNAACPAAPQSSGLLETISTNGNARLSVYFYRWDEHYDYASLGADRVYLPFVSMMKPGFRDSVKALKTAGTEVFAWLPSVTRGSYEKLIERFTIKKPEEGRTGENAPADRRAAASEATPADAVDGLLCGNAGTLKKLSRCGIRLAGDLPLNIFNTNSFLEAAGLGLESAALSAELTLQQAACIGKAVKAGNGSSVVPEAAVYGRLPLMISEYCPVGSIAGGFAAGSKCSAVCTGSDYSMRDRKGSEFPVLCDRTDCRSTILNSDILFVPEVVKALADAGIGLLRMYIWDEGPEQVRELVKLYKAALFDNNVRPSGFKAAMPNEGRYTKGHYFRGV